ncbi:MAG: hypothetical protein M1831_005233 [Alyxoria varia]|nr:MAG: hypothetical protein M1831_005233 [Alyxoria varia]
MRPSVSPPNKIQTYDALLSRNRKSFVVFQDIVSMNRRQFSISPAQSEICLFCLIKRPKEPIAKRLSPFLARRNVSSTAIFRGAQAEAVAPQDDQPNSTQSPSGHYSRGQFAKRRNPKGLSVLERAEIGLGAASSAETSTAWDAPKPPDATSGARYGTNGRQHRASYNDRSSEETPESPRRSIRAPTLDSSPQSKRYPGNQPADNGYYQRPIQRPGMSQRRDELSSRHRSQGSEASGTDAPRSQLDRRSHSIPQNQMTQEAQRTRPRGSHQMGRQADQGTDGPHVESYGRGSKRSFNPADIRNEMGRRRSRDSSEEVSPLRLQSDRDRANMPDGNRYTRFEQSSASSQGVQSAHGQDPYTSRDRRHETPRTSNQSFVKLSDKGLQMDPHADKRADEKFIKYEQATAHPQSVKSMNTRGAMEKHKGNQPYVRDAMKERRKNDRPSTKGAFREDQDRSSKGRKGRKSGYAMAEEEDGPDEEDLMSLRQKKEQRKRARQAEIPPTPIQIPPFISVQNLATAMKVRTEEFMRKLEDLGFEEIAMDHVMNAENAGLVAMEYNFSPIVDRSETQDLRARPPAKDKALLPARPPIVTIMGHVDHGKTTLLDNLRKSSVVASEFGGITQHIGAFSVPMASGKRITFLDTPGHAAFLSMRQRGATVTDIVVLVVAADDSVKPQTVEAIRHAKAAGVPIIVAVNKVDKDGADVHRVKQDLLQHEIEVEDFGGDIQAVEVSGKTGQGLADLEEAIVTLAELQDMRAEQDGAVEGWVLESSTEKAGRIATVLVRRGTLRSGDVIVAGSTWARVRTLHNEAGQEVESASPGTPIEVDGWRDQPNAGDEVLEASDEGKATDVVAFRQERDERLQSAIDIEAINGHRRIEADRRAKEKEAAAAAAAAASTKGKKAQGQIAQDAGKDSTQSRQQSEEEPHTTFKFIIKADVTGSAEAVAEALKSIPLSNFTSVSINIQRASNGAVTESDVAHAVAIASSSPGGTQPIIGSSDANNSQSERSKPRHIPYIVAFNTDFPPQLLQAAHRNEISVLSERVIYKVIDAARDMVERYLPPVVQRRVLGEAETAMTFDIKGSVAGVHSAGSGVKSKTTKVAGCRIRNGLVSKNAKVTVWRGGAVGEQHGAERVFDGTIASLKNQKKDVVEMRKGMECGMVFSGGWDGFREGDFVQCYEEVQERRKLT